MIGSLRVKVKFLNFVKKYIHVHSSTHYLVIIYLGPVVQSIIGLTSSLVVTVLTVLGSTICNSQVFLLKKNISVYEWQAVLLFIMQS